MSVPNSDALRPGEIDLESGATADPPADPPGDPAADPPAEAPADGDPPADAPADEGQPAKRQPTGAVGELIQLRREKKELAARLQQYETHPVLQRLTPDIQQAILEGRVSIAPPQASREAEQDRLRQVAEDLQLYKVDGTGQTVPDLDAAKRVSNFVRSEVQTAVEPVRHMSLAEKAQRNVEIAVQAAEQQGLDAEVMREEFLSILTQPNGAQLLAQKNVAHQVWRAAIGRMHDEGRLTAKQAKKAAAAAPETRANPGAAVVIEPPGRRGGTGSGITLSPGLQRVYAEHGVDPKKSFTARNNIQLGGPIDLE